MPEEERNKMPERQERLGWLSESVLQPRKQQAIEGVTGASLVNLRAELYELEQAARLLREEAAAAGAAEEELGRGRSSGGGSRLLGKRKAGVDISALARRNAGVDARNAADKAQEKSTSDRLAECYSALERKAALYNRLAAGVGGGEEEELYEVDFLRKGAPGAPPQSAPEGDAGLLHWDLDVPAPQEEAQPPPQPKGDEDSRGWEERGRGSPRRDPRGDEGEERVKAEAAAEQAQRERIAAVRAVNAETRRARDRAAVAREAREAQERRSRARLKDALLRRRAAALRGAGAAPAPGTAPEMAPGAAQAPGTAPGALPGAAAATGAGAAGPGAAARVGAAGPAGEGSAAAVGPPGGAQGGVEALSWK